uniref:NADP-dependent oxidoreductase domain-containing protein n=1 Tax=Leersia perrieri TaxID=77586 RepID=A0A0D9W5K0_9ORYZ
MASAVPKVALMHGNARPMPAVGMGTAEFPVVAERTRGAVLAAIEAGYRHFDTASLYGTEAPVGEAVAEATRRGLLASRRRRSSRPSCGAPSATLTSNLQMEYVDLYLIHWPISVKPGPAVFPVKKEDAVPFDFEGVWRAMEECHRLGLTKAIGVSNFTTKHLEKLLAVATILPAVNQGEMNPVWQQWKVRDYCNAKGIHVTAYSPLGGQWGGHGNDVMESPVLAEIARARGKSIAQVSLRWIYELGVTPIAKSYKKERLKQNLEIFDWELTEDDHLKISKIPQKKTVTAARLFTTAAAVPGFALRHGNARPMPAVGMGTAEQANSEPGVTRSAVLAAIEVGFRHFDTAASYGMEAPIGDAIAEAARRGLVASREEVFVTSKLWCSQCHPELVLPSLRESLRRTCSCEIVRNLQMEYVDLYLIHMPISLKPGTPVIPMKKEDAVPFDFEGVWRAMEQCHRLGLAKAIGVSNFTTKHLDKLLAVATIPPAVNQFDTTILACYSKTAWSLVMDLRVEMNPVWQQRTLREYCAAKGIHVVDYSSLGGQNWGGGGNDVMESPVLAEIAEARDKTVAQVSLRWIYEQGVTPIAKSYNKERLKKNLELFHWELTEEDRLKTISRRRRLSQLHSCSLRMVSSHRLIFQTSKLWRNRC